MSILDFMYASMILFLSAPIASAKYLTAENFIHEIGLAGADNIFGTL